MRFWPKWTCYKSCRSDCILWFFVNLSCPKPFRTWPKSLIKRIFKLVLRVEDPNKHPETCQWHLAVLESGPKSKLLDTCKSYQFYVKWQLLKHFWRHHRDSQSSRADFGPRNGQIEKCSATFLVRNEVEIAFRGHFGHVESIWGGPKCGFDPNENVTNHVDSTVFCVFLWIYHAQSHFGPVRNRL